LQVQGRNGEWVVAQPIEDTLVVNIGDLMARWTNNQFKSTPHRVINRSGRQRLSIGIFVDPNYETEVVPICRDGEAPLFAPGSVRRLHRVEVRCVVRLSYTRPIRQQESHPVARGDHPPARAGPIHCLDNAAANWRRNSALCTAAKSCG
jgi:isopenicillin N synthase-like dioxygenase